MAGRAIGLIVSCAVLACAATAPAQTAGVARVKWGAATAHPARGGGVLLSWRTRSETANVGFAVYRARRATPRARKLLTPRLVAGTALKIGASVTRSARTSYRWFDRAGKKGDRYWIRDVDVSAKTVLHGPTVAKGRKVKRRPSSPLLPGSSTPGPTPGPTGVPNVPVPTVTPSPTIAPGTPPDDVEPVLAERQTVRVGVSRAGWTRMALADLKQLGADTSKPENLHVYTGGREIPAQLTADALSFYGRGVDTLDTGTRTYVVDTQTGPGLRLQTTADDPAAPAAPETTPASVTRTPRTLFFSALTNGEDSNFFGPVVNTGGATQTVNAFGLATAAGATLTVTLQGVNLVDHAVDVALNGQSLGTMTFSGQAGPTQVFADVPAVAGANTVKLTAGRAGDVSLVATVRLRYTRTVEPEADEVDLEVSGGQRAQAGPFTATGAQVLDVTDPEAPAFAAAQGQRTVAFTAAGSGTRRLYAFAPGAAQGPAAYGVGFASKLRTPDHDGALTLITRAKHLAALRPLVDRRRAQGLTVSVVDLQDVYDEFSHGQTDHHAIRAFLDYARENWRTPPRYVLLGGDGTYDPRGFLGGDPDADGVPIQPVDTAYGEAVSDSALAGTLSTGRLPARTPAAMQKLVAKVLLYEDAPPVPRALVVSDVSDTGPFAADADALRQYLPSDWTVTRVDRGTQDDAHQRVLDGLGSGPALVDYIGHGSIDLWRGNLLAGKDAPGLGNTGQPSFYVHMTCLNGYFADPKLDSLAERLLNADGGAAGVFSSTAQANPAPQAVANRALLAAIYGQATRPRAGDAITSSLTDVGDPDVRASWTLLGDPSMPLH